MGFDPGTHHRRSIRLRNWDYASAGAYFVTICVADRAPVFGTIEDGQMRPNELGDLVAEYWHTLPRHFPTIGLDTFVVMPNHVHFIVWLSPPVVGAPSVGAQSAGAQCVGAQSAAGAQCVGAQSAGAQCVGAQCVGAQCVGAQSAGAQSAGAQSAGAQSAGAQSAGAQCVGAQCVGAQCVGAQFNCAPTDDTTAAKPASPIGKSFRVDKQRPTLGQVVRAFKAGTARLIRRSGRGDEFAWQRNYYEHIIRDDNELARIRRYILGNPANWATDRDNSHTVTLGLPPSILAETKL